MSHGENILVVDDTLTNLEFVTDTLVSQGYAVTKANSGNQALAQLQTCSPELILLDVQMPGIDGFETCRQIKANSDWATIPIIFLTALTDPDSIVEGLSIGAVDYIHKPFREAVLLARVKTHIKLYQMTHRLEQRVSEHTHALESTMVELKKSQLQLVQQEKMSALGNMMAGVAHEINNPIGFVRGNVKELRRNLVDIFAHLELYQQKASLEEIEGHAEAVDIDFLLSDMPKMLDSMETGCDRIRNISTSLRTFSRADKDTKTAFDVHQGIDSTLLILKYRLKDKEFRPAIQVIRDYGDIPQTHCFPGQLNQVFMNLLANAIDMFDEMAEDPSDNILEVIQPQIIIRTSLVTKPGTASQTIEISIADNGNGMTQETCTKIFDRQFTTKTAGKGTGLGLAIAQQIIIEKHSGQINVKSAPEKGTEFLITLPLIES